MKKLNIFILFLFILFLVNFKAIYALQPINIWHNYLYSIMCDNNNMIIDNKVVDIELIEPLNKYHPIRINVNEKYTLSFNGQKANIATSLYSFADLIDNNLTVKINNQYTDYKIYYTENYSNQHVKDSFEDFISLTSQSLDNDILLYVYTIKSPKKAFRFKYENTILSPDNDTFIFHSPSGRLTNYIDYSVYTFDSFSDEVTFYSNKKLEINSIAIPYSSYTDYGDVLTNTVQESQKQLSDYIKDNIIKKCYSDIPSDKSTIYDSIYGYIALEYNNAIKKLENIQKIAFYDDLVRFDTQYNETFLNVIELDFSENTQIDVEINYKLTIHPSEDYHPDIYRIYYPTNINDFKEIKIFSLKVNTDKFFSNSNIEFEKTERGYIYSTVNFDLKLISFFISDSENPQKYKYFGCYRYLSSIYALTFLSPFIMALYVKRRFSSLNK